MGKIVCEQGTGCAWPNCECTWQQSPVEQRKSLAPGVDRPRYDAPVQPAGMYAGSKHQKADPERMRAVLADQFGPIIGTPARRVIPIKAEQAPQLFDADIVEIMLRQAGAVTEGFYIVIKRRETLEKLAEALNNLGS